MPVAAQSSLFRPRVFRPGASRGPVGEPRARGRHTPLVRREIHVADEAASTCGSRVQRYIEMTSARCYNRKTNTNLNRGGLGSNPGKRDSLGIIGQYPRHGKSDSMARGSPASKEVQSHAESLRDSFTTRAV